MRAIPTRCFPVVITLALMWVGGCAALTNHDEDSIIRIQSNRNPVKAQRLTLAGVNALENDKRDYAEEKLLAAIEADPQYGPAHNNLGLLHFDNGDLYRSVLAFERAMELMPQDPTVYYNLGLALETAGRREDALNLYWQAVEIDPTEPNFLGNLVRLRRRLGEKNPEVIAQLQDLILIETRPDWKRWAAEQLALNLNPNLDRGPDTPEFDSGTDDQERNSVGQQERANPTVIDLSPAKEDSAQPRENPPETEPEVLPPARAEPDRATSAIPRNDSLNQPENDARTNLSADSIPIRNQGAFNSLPDSITDARNQNLSEFLSE